MQYKTCIQDKCAALLDAALESEQAVVPTIGTILKGALKQNLTNKERMYKKMLQISFIITTTDGYVLITHRDSQRGGRLLSGKECVKNTKGLHNLKAGTNLTSYSPDEMPEPASYVDLIRGLNTKIPNEVFVENPIKGIDFLGIARNKRTDDKTNDVLYTYYYYIFELKVDLKKSDIFESIIQKRGKNDRKDFENLMFVPLDMDILQITADDFLVEKAASRMLLLHHGFSTREIDDSIHVHSAAIHRLAGNATPFEKVAGAYFISHSRHDKNRYLDAFILSLDERNIPYWIQNKHAQQGENWNLANKLIIPHCKHFICIETPGIRCNPNILEEIAIAVNTNMRYPEYKVFRIQSSDFFTDASESDPTKKFTQETYRRELMKVLNNEMLVTDYLNKTVWVIETSKLQQTSEWNLIIDRIES